MMEIYMKPMKKNYQKYYDVLSQGLNMVQTATEEIIRSFGFQMRDNLVIEDQLTPDNIAKLNVVDILKLSFNKFINL